MRFNMLRMRIIKGAIPFASALIMASVANAQSITNVDANQEGKAIAITYDLNEMADISLYVTQDGGATKTLIPQSYLAGDSGKRVAPGIEKKVLWRVLDQCPDQNFKGENMSFIVKGKPSIRFFTVLNAGYSLDSGFNMGVTVGQFGSIGWYVKGMTTFATPQKSAFGCDENGYVDGTLPAYSGIASAFKAYGVAGVTIRLGAPVYLNVGLGYGTRVYDWQTTDGNWVKNIPGSYNGLAIDAGLMTKIGSIALSAGTTLVNGRIDLCVGMGYIF